MPCGGSATEVAITMKGKHQRLILIVVAMVALIGAVLLAMSALKDEASTLR